MPPIDILDKTVDVEFSEADNTRRAEVIEEALAIRRGRQDGSDKCRAYRNPVRGRARAFLHSER